MILPRLAAALLSLSIVSTTSAADPAAVNQKHEDACIAQMKERTATFVAQDWSQLERLAERYLKTCKDIFGAEDSSNAYGEIAMSNIELGNARKALSASDKCISTFYANPRCHLERVQALIKLERLPDAKSALDKADRLIKHATDLGRRDLKSARTALESELAEARLNYFGAQQSEASAMRERYFPE